MREWYIEPGTWIAFEPGTDGVDENECIYVVEGIAYVAEAVEVVRLKNKMTEIDLQYREALREQYAEYKKFRDRYAELENALFRISLLGSGEHAYTSEFTEKVNGIVRTVLATKETE